MLAAWFALVCVTLVVAVGVLLVWLQLRANDAANAERTQRVERAFAVAVERLAPGPLLVFAANDDARPLAPAIDREPSGVRLAVPFRLTENQRAEVVSTLRGPGPWDVLTCCGVVGVTLHPVDFLPPGRPAMVDGGHLFYLPGPLARANIYREIAALALEQEGLPASLADVAAIASDLDTDQATQAPPVAVVSI